MPKSLPDILGWKKGPCTTRMLRSLSGHFEEGSEE